ncbi:MAG TPA: spore coat protein [Methanofastidiosum sp.]|nr:spore coat protein [Methanofastidiosum sp.]
MEQKIVAIIQSRYKSTRLPGKAVLKIEEKPLLTHVIERAKKIEGIDKLCVATGEELEDFAIVEIARRYCDVFQGSTYDVLDRYIKAARQYKADYIMRITGDNPFICFRSATKMISMALENGYDFLDASGLPLGCGVEIVKYDALLKVFNQPHKWSHKEHVTIFIKENKDKFLTGSCHFHVDNPYPKLRLTVDYREDFELAKTIYNFLYRGTPFDLIEVIDLLKEKPDLLKINEKYA